MRRRKWLVPLALLVLWLTTAVTVVPAQSVKTYRAIARRGNVISMPAVALTNYGNSRTLRFKWPLMIGGIGFVDETLSLDATLPNDFQTKFGLNKSSDRGGDSDTIDALFIKGSYIITDPNKFFANVDLDEANATAEREPFARSFKNRGELVGELTKNVMTPQELRNRIGLWEQELLWRRNFAIGIVQQLGLKDPAEIKKLIKEKMPWYWMSYETFWQWVLSEESHFGFTAKFEPSWTRELPNPKLYDPMEPIKLHLQISKLAWDMDEFGRKYRETMPAVEKARKDLTAKAEANPATKKKFQQAVAMVMEFKTALVEVVPGGLGGIPAEQQEQLQSLVSRYLDFAITRAKHSKQPVPDKETIVYFAQLVSIEWTADSLNLEQKGWQETYEKEILPYFTNLLTDKGPIGRAWRSLFTEKENEALWDAAIDEALNDTHFKDANELTSSAIKEMQSAKDSIWKIIANLNTIRTRAGREMLRDFVSKNGADLIRDRMAKRLALLESYAGIKLTSVVFSIEPVKQSPGQIDPDFFDLYEQDQEEPAKTN